MGAKKTEKRKPKGALNNRTMTAQEQAELADMEVYYARWEEIAEIIEEIQEEAALEQGEKKPKSPPCRSSE